jgi:hypothetical protein
LAEDLSERDRQLADLQQVLATKNEKLVEAQKTQTDMLRKQRELDDATRELELSVEKKVQESLTAVRDEAKLEAEEALKAKVTEKETQIASLRRPRMPAETGMGYRAEAEIGQPRSARRHSAALSRNPSCACRPRADPTAQRPTWHPRRSAWLRAAADAPSPPCAAALRRKAPLGAPTAGHDYLPSVNRTTRTNPEDTPDYSSITDVGRGVG